MFQEAIPTDPGSTFLELAVLVEFVFIVILAVQMFRLSAKADKPDCCKKAKAWAKAHDVYTDELHNYLKTTLVKNTIGDMQTVICQHRKFHASRRRSH